MRGGRRPDATSLLVAVGLLAILLFGPVASTTIGADSDVPSADQRTGPILTVSPSPNSASQIWPYTSRRKSFDSATLPINVVVLADPTLVRAVLMVGPDATWENQSRGLNGSGAAEGTGEGEFARVSVNGSGLRWDEARGAARYTYVSGANRSEGRWIGETYQLHDGDYFGSRYHIRFYEVPDRNQNWTAMQVHKEYWDWFRLRHTVGSLSEAQHYVEREFYDRWYVVDVKRQRFTGGGILDSDGWATVVDFRSPRTPRLSGDSTGLLVGIVAAGGVGACLTPARRRRLRSMATDPPTAARAGVLALSLLVLPLAVRFGALAVEGAGVVNSPKVVAAAFFPVLVVGIPLSAFALASKVAPEQGFVAAVVGLGIGFLIDYGVLEIAVLPIEVVLHRVALLVAVGLLAAGSAGRDDGWPAWWRSSLAGVAVWVCALCWSLFLM